MIPLLGALALACSGLQAGCTRPVVARVGVEVPIMGIAFTQAGHDWPWSLQQYFSPADMAEIKSALHADFVRTGFIPDWVNKEPARWRHEDRVMDDACAAGLSVLVIVPLEYDRRGDGDLIAIVREFFTRYLAREPGCGMIAEFGNEHNLDVTPEEYARRWAELAPEVRALGIPVVTAGTSGVDKKWLRGVTRLIGNPQPDAFGLHPYGSRPNEMPSILDDVAAASSNALDEIYITEYGSYDAGTLSEMILAMASQPVMTVYEYRCQPTDGNCGYGLKDNPALFNAVASAFESIQERRANVPSPFRTASPGIPGKL